MRVTDLRDLVRQTILDSGARGFVRFAPGGNALLVTDAPGRCADGGALLLREMERAGFSCWMDGVLGYILPGDALLGALCERKDDHTPVDWSDPLHPAQALANRLLREAKTALTEHGRALLMETARLLWQPQAQVMAGLDTIRARVAAMLREGERSGLFEAGALLANWCEDQAAQQPTRKGRRARPAKGE